MTSGFRQVFVDLAKLRDYCLNETHPRGRHKARLFRLRLGLTAADSEHLRQTLISAVQDHPEDIKATVSDAFGQRYVLDFPMTTSMGSAIIRSAWIVAPGQDMLRFLTCFIV